MITPRKLMPGSARSWQTFTSCAVILIGCLVLIGWQLNSALLKSGLPELTAMTPNSALCFVLLGIALRVLPHRTPARGRKLVSQICAAFISLIGLLTLSEYIFDVYLGIDQVLFLQTGTNVTQAFPGRMAEVSALSFLFAGISLGLFSVGRWYGLAQFLSGLVGFIGLFTFAGYLYGAALLYDLSGVAAVSLPTSVALMLVSISLLLTHPYHALVGIVSGQAAGGIIARRLLPTAILFPLIIGWFRLKGQSLGLYGTEAGLALFAIANVITFTLLIWWNARSLNELDLERRRSFEHVGKLHRTLSVLSDVNQAIVRIRDLSALYETSCAIAIEKGGFPLIWIGLIDPTTDQMTLTAHACAIADYQDYLQRTLIDSTRLPALIKRLQETHDHVVYNDIPNDPQVSANGREMGERFAFQSAVLLPLWVSGSLRGVICLYAKEIGFFDDAELRLMDEMAGDIAFAMEFSEQETKRREAEQALYESEQRFRSVVEDQTELICRYDTNLKLTFVNRAYAASFGMLPEEMIGRCILDMIPSEEWEQSKAHIRSMNPNNLVATSEHQSIMPDNTTRWVQWTDRALLGASGEIVQYQGVGRDVTDQKRLQEQQQQHAAEVEVMRQFLQTTLDALSANIAVLDPDGRIINVNDGWERFNSENGGVSTVAYLNTNYLETCDVATGPMSEEAAPAAEGIRAVINRQRDNFYLEYPCDSLIEQRWFGMRVTPFNEPAPCRVVVAHIDITERKLIEEAERRQRLFAEAMRDSLAALVSSLDIQIVMRQLLFYAERVVPFDAACIIQFDDETAFIAHQRGFTSHEDKSLLDLRFTIADSFYFRALQQNQSYVIDETLLDAKWIHYSEADWTRSALGVPIVIQGSTFGALTIDSKTPHMYTQEDVEHLRVFARYASLALENARRAAYLEERVADRTRELSHAKERVEAILNNSTDGIVLLDADLKIRQTNPAFERLFVFDAEDAFDRYLLDFIHPEDAGGLVERFRTLVGDQHGKHIDVRCVRSDQTQFEASFSMGYFTDMEKREGFVCVIQDITKRKQEQQLLAEERNMLRTLIDTTPDFIYIKDTHHRFLLSNMAHAKARGKNSPDELLGKTDADFFPQEDAARFHAEEDEIFRTGIPLLDYEQPSITPEQYGFLWASSNKVPLHNLRGDLVGLVGITRDITDRKERERQLRYHASLQENVSDAVIVTDMNFNIQSWNRAAERIYGWSADEALGKSVGALLKTESRDAEERQRRAAALFEAGWWQGEVIQYHKDGTSLYILGSVTLIRDEHGLPASIVAVNHDVTERKLIEKALQDSSVEIQDLYNNAPCGYHSIDADGTIVQINDTELHWLGYRRDEVIDTLKITDIFTRESTERFMLDFPAFKERGWVSDLEFDLVRKDGSTMHILLNGTAIYGEDGQYLRSRSTMFDITAIQEAQRALRESEARYRLLAENIGDLVARIDTMGNYVYVSPSSRDVLGYEPAELLGRSGFEFIHPDDVQDVVSRQIAALNPDVPTTPLIYRTRHRNGSYIWLETRGQILWSQDNSEPLSFITVSRNITERKQAEEALALSEQRYSLIVNGVKDYAIYVLDPEGKVASWNSGAQHIKGYSAEEIIGQNFKRFYTQKDIADDLPGKILQIAESEGHFVGEGWRVRKDGTQFWAEVVVTRVHDIQNNLIGFTKITRDLTERKRIENALLEQRDFLQLVVDNVPDLIMVKDYDGYFQLANNLIAEIYDVKPADMIGKTDVDLSTNNQDVIFFNESDQETIRSGRPVFIPEEKLLGRFYQTSRIPLKQPDGTYDRILIVASDITDRKNAEEVLLRAFHQEKELGELKSRFVSMASHEFRTPLATILAAAETLSAYRPKMTESQIDHRINNIREQVEHLKNIIEDVLQLARIQAGRLDFNPTILNLDGLCRSVIDEFESRPDVSHQLVYSCAEVLREIQLDKKLMRQIINNLVSNAIKYSPAGEKVFISLEYSNESVVLIVRDQGIGIPEGDLKHLFEPFHRAANVGAISGTGLGLSIVKEAVELHGGTIQVDSTVGVGTNFVVTIPLASQSEDEHDENTRN